MGDFFFSCLLCCCCLLLYFFFFSPSLAGNGRKLDLLWFTMDSDKQLMKNMIHTNSKAPPITKSIPLAYLCVSFIAASFCIVGVHSFSPAALVRRTTLICPAHEVTATSTIVAACARQRRSRYDGQYSSFSSFPTPFHAHWYHPLRRNLSSTTTLFVATTTSSSSSNSSIEYPLASDGEAIQILFANYCDSDGLMTEDQLRNVPAIKEMLVSD